MEKASNNIVDNKRIAKNTMLLYFRTMFIMVITLYTSRVILNALGVEDYGIYNVVGGVIAMFSVISGALSSSISRFITFEIGRKNLVRLKTVFSTSINIQIGIALLIILLGEVLGVWFLNYKMEIPEGRLIAANWVLQCSLITFCINLISVPYNACIIAHERMSAFAYISILEATLKLAICYLVLVSSFDKLIVYSILMVLVSLILRLAYGIYCSRNFDECHYHLVYDKSMLKEMTRFAGWSFFTNMAWIFNTQGVNLLINIFFGVTLNAARGVATQVEGAVLQFVCNFTTAVNPQITKAYAVNEKEQMFVLICRGAKFSFLLLLLITLPILMETEYILRLWLKIVPEHTVMFVQLAIIGTMMNIIGNTGYTACMATGRIKRYSIYITLIGMLVFPFTWVAFSLGMPAEVTYVIYILVYLGVDIVRLYIMKGLLGFPSMMFVRLVALPICLTAIASIPIPILIIHSLESSFLRLCITCMVSFVSVGLFSCLLGLTAHERKMTIGKIVARINK